MSPRPGPSRPGFFIFESFKIKKARRSGPFSFQGRTAN
ncbi:hypothetical protein TDIS_0412 [Thermosulfurimonas dismutans]|uniref:Uncharacterized protein n=1 Tax=Thermosulfurimonas dismutans TaxID=999894 RepID=A0A179D723_9BACT|nr:hypothetical protein TDIS_0412 [Thermosulfurimonas dismutans]